MTAPMPETMTSREVVVREVTKAFRDFTECYAAGDSIIDRAADAILTALASTGDHAELAGLAERATEGPWEWWSSCSHWRLTGADSIDGGVISAKRASDGFPLVVCKEDDRAFIAASRTAVPALLAENAALRGEVGHLYREDLKVMALSSMDDELEATKRSLAEARRLLEEAVSDLEGEISSRYENCLPQLQRQYDRDMDIVVRSRAFLAAHPEAKGDGR